MPDRAEIEAATDALLADSALPRYGAHRNTVERRVRIALEAADRVRDARDDDEGPKIGSWRCPRCGETAITPSQHVCPQGEDHEPYTATVEDHEAAMRHREHLRGAASLREKIAAEVAGAVALTDEASAYLADADAILRIVLSDPASVLAALLAESPEATVAAIEALLTSDEAVTTAEEWRAVRSAVRSLLSKAPKEDGDA
jgi:hypothetical protein